MAPLLFIAAGLAGFGQGDLPARPVEPTPWGEFGRYPGRGLSPITIYLGTVPSGSDNRHVYWAKRVVLNEGGTIDSVKCPALVMVIESMRDIRLPKTAPGDPQLIIADGTSYSLSVASSYQPPTASNLDKLTITSGDGPLADWVNDALEKLEGCWSSI